jgi:hypothetical protein
MKKNIFLLLICCTFLQGISAQQFSFGFSTGIGSYSMEDMKMLNKTVIPDFDAKLVSDFPAYLYFSPSACIRLKTFIFGLNYTYQSTGSLISAKDYSGEYRFETLIHSNNIGIMMGAFLLKTERIELYAYAKFGKAFTQLNITEHLDLLDTVLFDNRLNVVADNFYTEPGFALTYKIYPFLSAELNLGYYLDFGAADLHLKDNKKAILQNPETGKNVTAQWAGIRAGITLQYTFNLRKPESEE